MVLGGSVRLERDRFRISSQLIDARTDEHLWAETYDRRLDDIFEIQTDVAERIAAALEVKISTAEKKLLAKRPTDDFRAYNAYMKARDYYQRYRYDDNENAIELFNKSIALDSDFALAYAGLADAYSQRVNTWAVNGHSSNLAMEAAEKAVSIDPDLAEGHKALGFCYSNNGWLTKALESYKRALALRPGYDAAMLNLAVVLHTVGRWDDALVWTRRRLQHTPDNVIACTNMGEILNNLGFRKEASVWLTKALAGEPFYFDAYKQLAYEELFSGQVGAARKRLTRLLKVHPNTVGTLLVAGETELFDDKPEAAREYFERAIEASQGTSVYAHLRMGDLLSRMDERKQAEAHLAYVRQECQGRVHGGGEAWFDYWALAVDAAARDEREEALDWLAKAVDRGRLYYGWDQKEPAFENLRELAGFQRLMDHMRSKVEKQSRHVRDLVRRRELLLTP